MRGLTVKTKLVSNVVIHVGLHKTGSTSLQAALSKLNHNKFRTVKFGYENHSVPMYTIFSGQASDYHIWKNPGFSDEEVDGRRATFINQLLDELVFESGPNTLVISGEDISILEPSEKVKLLNFFLTRDIAVRIIGYVRDPISWVVSEVQERMKSCRALTDCRPDFKLKFEPFIDILKEENVSIYHYEEVLKTHGSIVKHFAENLGIKLVEQGRKNMMLTPIQLALLYRLNRVPLQVNGNPGRYQLRLVILNKIFDYLDNEKFQLEIEPEYFNEFMSTQIEEDYDWLKERFSTAIYDLSLLKNDLKFSDYIETILSASNVNLNEFFATLGHQFDKTVSIENNFLEVYVSGLENSPRITFDAERYLLLNPDVKLAGVNPYEHYLKHGLFEGRRIN